jgi:antitoxin ParD1/3/4
MSWYSNFVASVESRYRMGLREDVWPRLGFSNNPRYELLEEVDNVLDEGLPQSFEAVSRSYATLNAFIEAVLDGVWPIPVFGLLKGNKWTLAGGPSLGFTSSRALAARAAYMTIGVLALQGDFDANRREVGAVEHRHKLSYYEVMAMTSLNISLPEALKEYVEGQVASGDWGTPSEYVRELIRQDKERRLGNLEQELVAAAKGRKIELPVPEIRRKGLVAALRERARRR